MSRFMHIVDVPEAIATAVHIAPDRYQKRSRQIVHRDAYSVQM